MRSVFATPLFTVWKYNGEHESLVTGIIHPIFVSKLSKRSTSGLCDSLMIRGPIMFPFLSNIANCERNSLNLDTILCVIAAVLRFNRVSTRSWVGALTSSLSSSCTNCVKSTMGGSSIVGFSGMSMIAFPSSENFIDAVSPFVSSSVSFSSSSFSSSFNCKLFWTVRSSTTDISFNDGGAPLYPKSRYIVLSSVVFTSIISSSKFVTFPRTTWPLKSIFTSAFGNKLCCFAKPVSSLLDTRMILVMVLSMNSCSYNSSV